MSKPKPTGAKATPPRIEGQLPPAILVVDDEAGIRRLYTKALTSFGYHMESAEDGVGGWEKLCLSSYDLLITDNNMPKMYGIELVRKLRSANMDLPVILATADPPENTEPLRLSAVLLKPFNLDTLRRTVEEALQSQMPAGAAPRLRRLASRLITYEAGLRSTREVGETVAFSVLEKLRVPFGNIAGSAGYHSLLSRAQALAGAEVVWLRSLRADDDGSLAGLNDAEAGLDPQTVVEGEVVLLAHLLGLLNNLIGPALTLQLLHLIWPKLDDLDL